jgi:FkbM family methyltransferase
LLSSYDTNVTGGDGATNNVRPPLVLDIGMNIGWFSLYSRAHGHDVASFEPNPTMFLRMCESLEYNNWKDDDGSVTLWNYGLGATGKDDPELITMPTSSDEPLYRGFIAKLIDYFYNPNYAGDAPRRTVVCQANDGEETKATTAKRRAFYHIISITFWCMWTDHRTSINRNQ